MGGLAVEYGGTIHRADLASGLTFGRMADIVLHASDRRMSRRLGKFAWRDAGWWLEHTGNNVRLVVTSLTDGSGFDLPPGGSARLWVGPSVVRFRIGATEYELLCDNESEPASSPSSNGDVESEPADLSDATVGVFPLTPDQRRLLACLAERHLRDPGRHLVYGWDVPSNQSVAARLEWPLTTYNRKLDRLHAKYARLMEPQWAERWREPVLDRRQQLVCFAVTKGLIGTSDLPSGSED